jgi:hypothetical protein
VCAAQRTFRGVCPKCGPVLTQRLGHHATIQEKLMKEQIFPKDVRAIIRRKLEGVELKAFNRTIEGKLMPTSDQLQHWKLLGGHFRLGRVQLRSSHSVQHHNDIMVQIGQP